MKKRIGIIFLCLIGFAISLAYQGCSAQTLADGTYRAEVSLSGGTGRATVESPALLTVQDGEITAELVWSSSNYDYMVVKEEKYLPTTLEPGSTFSIPVEALDVELTVTADTVAMSQPHEIEYTLRFDSSTMERVK